MLYYWLETGDKEGGKVVDYLKRRPMLLSGLCASAMCVIGFYSRTAIFFLGLILILLFFFLLQKGVYPVYIFVVFMLVATSVSVLTTYNKIDEVSGSDGATVKGSFSVVETPVNHGEYYSAVVKARDCGGLKDGTRILVFCNEGDFEYGDKIIATVKLSKINDKYRASDYSEKIYLTGYMDDLTIYSGEGGFVISRVNKLRRYIVDTLFSNMNYKEAATLTALTVGDRSYLSDEFYANLKAAGVSHLMVVSGIHLSIIVSLVSKLIEKILYNRYLKAITVLLTVLFMEALCGFTKSIIRAGLCYIIYAASIVLKRDNTPENTLGAAVTLILIAEPFAILSVSFQLSVLATLGITAAALPVTKYLKDNVFKNTWLLYIVDLAIVTLSALLFTLPVTVWVFGYVSAVAVIANVLVSYAVTLSLYFAAAGLVFYYVFPLGGQILLVADSLVTKYVNFIINTLGSLPFAAVRLGDYSFIFALLLLFSVIFGLFACKHRQDMLKLKIMHEKIISEGGGKLKWR